MAEPGGPISNPLEGHLGYLLRRASSAAMAALARRLAALGLRPAEASILVLIEANPEITQSSIGRVLGVQRTNMAPLMAGLMARSLISREPIDRKSHGFQLTGNGRALASQVMEQMREHEADAFGLLSADALSSLDGQLRKILEATANPTVDP